MQMRLDQLMDASARMDDVRMGPSHPITHTGRPDRRGIETTTRSTSMQRGKVRHSTVKGYREMKADMMKRIQNGGMSSSSTSSSSSMDSSAGSY
jgi:hypothetical protein